ncbi:MAG: hypothetical protein Q9196_005176 [Gyalolechia fulgens]
MSHSRTLLRLLPRSTLAHRTFTTTRPAFVNVGDAIPNIDLVEGSPGNKVNLANELKGKGVIIGVPAAFTGQVFVVSVNDAFVMKAWGATLDPTNKSGIRFLGDPDAKFTEALDLSFESASIFGNNRSKRYALVVEDGKVKEAHVEPDNTGVDGRDFPPHLQAANMFRTLIVLLVSAADKVLK